MKSAKHKIYSMKTTKIIFQQNNNVRVWISTKYVARRMGYMEIAFNCFMENTLYYLICQQSVVESSNGRMTLCKDLSHQI